jgi:glucose/arabinose dehydrogenase
MKSAPFVQVIALSLIIIGSLSFISRPSVQNLQQVAAISGAGSGLIDYYAFDEGSGTIANDSSGSGHTGIMNGTVGWTTGKVGANAVSFNGATGNGISFGRIGVSTTFTYAAWIYVPSGTVNSFANLMTNGNAIGLWINNDKIDFDAGGAHVSNTTITRGAWHHIAVVDNATSVTFYLDGNPDGTASVTTDMYFDGMGCDGGNGSECFTGYQDDVRLYNRPLDSSEIGQLFALGGGVSSPPPSGTFSLTVSKTGTGSGTVSGGSISCGSTCTQSNINSGTSVTLSASPASGSTFGGWSGGGCSGTGSCSVTVSSNTTVTATFTSAGGALPPPSTASGTPLPGTFVETSFATLGAQPTSMAFAPDGRLFVTLQNGNLRVIKNGTLLATPALTLTVDGTGERGLLGVEFDPNFASNQFIYVYYTTPTPAVHNRVSRFTMSGDVAVAGSELVLLELDNLSTDLHHNGGSIHFGTDGKLYIATGDNSSNTNSQSMSSLLGKILRINSDGSIPTTNPFYSSASGNYRVIWALGLRNPFTFSIDPFIGKMYINDVGNNLYEEVNQGIAGANYGWPTCEGACSTAGFTNPVIYYDHVAGRAITGGVFYRKSQFGNAYDGVYFYADYLGGWIHTLDGNGVDAGWRTANAPIDLDVGPDGSLYYLSVTNQVVWKISSTNPTVSNILTVSKSGTGSGTVTSPFNSINCGGTCSLGGWATGELVTLTATPAAGSTFTGWSGGGCSGTGTCQVAVNGNTTVTASFTAGPSLTITKSGTGSGTVTSSGGSINCGATCTATGITPGTISTLTATAASGSTFAGWSGGGCSGTGTCTVTVNANTTVTATFNTTVSGGGTDFYVSKSGNDANPGTQASPWLTIGKCATTIKAGSNCNVAAGNYDEFVKVQNFGGTSDTNRIKYIANGTVTVRGFFIWGEPYITIQGFDITGVPQAGSSFASIHLYPGADNCEILNNTIRDKDFSGNAGIKIDINGSGATSNNCVFRGNTLKNLQTSFVTLNGANHLFEGNNFLTLNNHNFFDMGGHDITIRGNFFNGGPDYPGTGDHPDVFQSGPDNGGGLNGDAYNFTIENNWIQNMDAIGGQLGQMDAGGYGGLAPNIHDWTFKNNVIINISANANTELPGLKWEHNTFYHMGYAATGINVSGSFTRGNPSRNTIINNAFIAGGDTPTRNNDSSGFYHYTGFNLTIEALTTLLPTDYNTAVAINTNLASNGYLVNANGMLTAKARNMPNDINQFTLSSVYSANKTQIFNLLYQAAQYETQNRLNSVFDYNFVAGSGPTWYPKDSSGCNPDGIFTEYYFCEAHRSNGFKNQNIPLNGGDPKLQNINNPLGPDNTPFTLDDGLKPLSGSPLCGQGASGTDIGVYSCDPNQVLATGGSVVIPPPPPPTGDTTPPTVSVTTSPSGTVSGIVTIAANASDNVGVVGVQFKINGTNTGAEDTLSPFSITWDTSALSAGTYTITAVARDAAGNTTTSSGVTVTVAAALPITKTPDPSLPCKIGTKTIRAIPVVGTNSVTLSWPKNDFRTEIHIARRVYTNKPSGWGTWPEIYTVTNAATAAAAGTFTDNNVTSGVHYEYQISALESAWDCPDGPVLDTNVSNYWSYQYIDTGINVPLRDPRGNVVLLVESGIASSLSAELSRLQDDLILDGYKVFRHDVAAADVDTTNWKSAVVATRNLVKADYNTDTSADWSIFIVGHVPVPYSGLSSPGSHPENLGAHPADWYYADMTDSAWTDSTINSVDTSSDPYNPSQSFAAQTNTPGDGKFDQSYVPSAPEMRIGRIDLRNMPAFGKTEAQLLKQYLDRDHQWRLKQFTVRDRAIVNLNNNLGLIYTGAPAESHDMYASFFGTTAQTDIAAWLTSAITPSTSYLFSASHGNGHVTQDLQIGTTQNFASASTPLYVAFTSMYGSFYGDWDSSVLTNIVLQAPLASAGYTLNNYYRELVMDYDPTSMGEPTGQTLFQAAANRYNVSNWYTSYGWIFVTNPAAVPPTTQTTLLPEQMTLYMSLLGDPTLRVRQVAPPTAVAVSPQSADNLITWTNSTDANIQGYNIYRAPANNLNGFVKLNGSSPVTGSYRDVGAASGSYRYMVKAVKLEQTQNRSYYNASEGVYATSGTFVAKPGDFNSDGFVNSIDFSYMNSKWNTNDATADLNKDGVVNTLDYSVMIKNWTN